MQAVAAQRVILSYRTGYEPIEGYTINFPIGQGGFGEVYAACTSAGKRVALKLIKKHLVVREMRGIKTCMNLNHPNLVKIYDVVRNEEKDETWVVMELVSGQTLADMIRSQPKGMPSAKARQWLQAAGRAVDFLHVQGVVHRDLKPANVFIDEDGLIKVGDYGLAKSVSPSQRSGQTEGIGTPHYTAPEIYKGTYNKEVDIYAIGVMSYEMLTGALPFNGQSAIEIAWKHVNEKPDLALVPADWRQAVELALAKKPEERCKTVAEMLAAVGKPTKPIAPVVSASVSDMTGKSGSCGSIPSDARSLANRKFIGTDIFQTVCIGALLLVTLGFTFGCFFNWLASPPGRTSKLLTKSGESQKHSNKKNKEENATKADNFKNNEVFAKGNPLPLGIPAIRPGAHLSDLRLVYSPSDIKVNSARFFVPVKTEPFTGDLSFWHDGKEPDPKINSLSFYFRGEHVLVKAVEALGKPDKNATLWKELVWNNVNGMYVKITYDSYGTLEVCAAE